jgi:hypothetical protein
MGIFFGTLGPASRSGPWPYRRFPDPQLDRTTKDTRWPFFFFFCYPLGLRLNPILAVLDQCSRLERQYQEVYRYLQLLRMRLSSKCRNLMQR